MRSAKASPERSARALAERLVLACALSVGVFAQTPQRPQYPALPSETPPTFKPVTDSFDYDRRDVMIAMRDGVKLHTVILVPKGARRAPILFTRTPYNANEGIAQVLFFQGDEPCERSYKDKKGKYQAQRGVTLPKL